jgi:acetyltransferase-like isoleucine patch superfamily enzyme
MNADYAQVRIGHGTRIGEHCVLGCPKEARLRGKETGPLPPVVIGDRCLVFHHVVIYEGVRIGDGVVIEDRARIGYNSSIGAGTRVVYGAYMCDRVTIGTDTRIAGFVCDGAVIGDRSTVMGELVHEYTRPHQDWWEVDEEPPIIEPDSVVGYGARVVGGVRIGPCSYVAAGAVVTRDVPPEHIVTGVNTLTPASVWKGERLRGLIQHWVTRR